MTHDQQTSLWYLRSCSMFDLCSESELEQIGGMARVHSAIRDSQISLDQVGSHVYFIKSGFMKIVRVLPDGNEVVADLLGPGEFFGRIEDVSGADIAPFTEEYAVAIDEVMVCLFDRPTFERALMEFPSLNKSLLAHVADRVEYISTRLVDMAFRSANERFDGFLSRMAQRYGIRNGDSTRIPIRLTHSELGMLTGLSRQTVVRLVGDYRRMGRLEMTSTEIILNHNS
ncbi:MAG: Crp/Fnr family transcriptional regulator [Bacteroidota bacterium]|jgi:CRP/FNR family cyclic AMP-dependent transcriptional regulator